MVFKGKNTISTFNQYAKLANSQLTCHNICFSYLDYLDAEFIVDNIKSKLSKRLDRVSKDNFFIFIFSPDIYQLYTTVVLSCSALLMTLQLGPVDWNTFLPYVIPSSGIADYQAKHSPNVGR